jgi:deoxyribodipyrimidine photo-lyase
MTDSFSEIQNIIDGFIPAQYAQTRNFENGCCTTLSAYVSRGIISTSWIFNAIQTRGYSTKDCMGILQQLTWRDYFQRLLQYNPDLHQKAIRDEPIGSKREGLPTALINGDTQITAIDRAIRNLHQQGHIHNHLRLYIASCICNIANSKWQDGARWMYYYLKDADVASNFASWQWVSGASREKKYFANQSNINLFCDTQDHNTFLDFPMEQFPLQHIPKRLEALCFPNYPLHIPYFKPLQLRNDMPICIYTPYNIDPQWRQEQNYNRVLFFDARLMQRFPMSLQSIEFIISQALKIDAMQFFYGTDDQLQQYISRFIYYQKEHPVFNIKSARTDSRDWLFPEVTEVKGSFFKYWNTALCKNKL